MEIIEAIEKSVTYKAFYKGLRSANSVDDFFVSARVPLDSDVANDPIMRRRVEQGLRIDRICTRWIAIGWTLAFVWIALTFVWIAFGFTLTTILPFAWSILLNYVLPALGMIGNVTFYALIIIGQCLFVPNRPNPDISNQTIINGLEDCNVTIGNFEWTVIMTSVNDQCSGVLIHPNYVLTAGKLQHNHYISLKLNIIFSFSSLLSKRSKKFDKSWQHKNRIRKRSLASIVTTEIPQILRSEPNCPCKDRNDVF